MVVPVFGRHQRGNAQHGHRQSARRHRVAVLAHPFVQGDDAQTDPNGKYVKRTYKGIVTLTRLKRFVIGIDHNRQTRECEEQRHHPGVALVFLDLVDQTNQAQQKWQGVVHVARWVVGKVRRLVVLWAQTHLIQEGNAGDPVALGEFVAVLVVVLAAGEVPHEVAEPHLAHLVVHEEFKVVAKLQLVGRLDAHELLVVLHVVRLIAPHAREETYVALGVVGLRGLAVAGDFVFAGLLAVLVGGAAVRVGLARIQLAVKALAVENGPISVLVALVVGQERHSVLRVVLVNRRVGVGANGQNHKARIPNQQEDYGLNALRHEGLVFLFGPLDAKVNACSNQQKGQHRTRILGHADAVHRGNFQPAKKRKDEGDDDGKHQTEYPDGGPVGDDPGFPGDIWVLLVEVNHDHRWNGQEHQDVNAHRKARQIGNQEQPAVGIGV